MQSEHDVVLSIQGMQTDNDVLVDESQIVTSGRFTLHNGVARLSYSEDEDDGPITTVIEMNGDLVSVNRSGATNTNLAFIKGKHCKSVFMTPMGRLELDAYPTNVDYQYGEKGGSVRLAYQLCLQGEYVGVNNINIDFWPGKP